MALWNKIADLNEEAAALGYNNIVHFSPGVQLTQEIGGKLRETAISEQVAEMILTERRNKIVDNIFVPCEQPLLEAPETSRRNRRKEEFLHEMISIKPPPGTPWLILGDFNLIYKASDKNILNLNHRLMGKFRTALDECELMEICLQNRKFTWSNERENPTLVRLDRAFCRTLVSKLRAPCTVN